MVQKDLNFICFRIEIDETVRYRCQSTANKFIAEKDIIRTGNVFYFYVFNRNEETSTYSLRQITKEEFDIRKDEFLKCRPHKFCEEWTDGKNNYIVRNYYDATWRRNVPAADCIFFGGNGKNPLKEIYEAATALVELEKAQNEDYDRQARYEYSRKCGGLGQKLGIAYENVLRIGPEKGKLQKFKESYERAMLTVKQMPLAEVRQLHTDLFRCGRARRKQAMNSLEIKYFEVDVNLLRLDELQKLMEHRLNAYVATSCKQACLNAACADYEKRGQMYKDLMSSSRKQKKAVLQDLGINVDAINLNQYPLSEIKRTLAATLGQELER